MATNCQNNLTKYWIKVELETKQALRLAKHDFQKNGKTFDAEFRDYFVRTTNNRITQTFDQFLRDWEFEERFSGVRSNQTTAIQYPMNPMTMNEIESSEQLDSMNIQAAINGDGVGSSSIEKQTASTSNTIQSTKKKTGVGRKGTKSGSKGHKCAFCEYMTPRKSTLIDHTRIHTGEKPFKCEVCETGFTQKVTLKKHMRTHAKDFPFHCSNCRKGFKQNKTKDEHEKVCYLRPYQCYLCKYTMITKQNLASHMRYKHTGEKPFACSHYSKRFVEKGTLNKHLKRKHNKNK